MDPRTRLVQELPGATDDQGRDTCVRLGQDDLRDYVGFAPGLAVSFVLSLIASGRAARVLGVPRPVAWALLMAFGLVISATLTPSREALSQGLMTPSSGSAFVCDLSRMTPLSPTDLVRVTDSTLNVYLFIPLGLIIGLARRSRHWQALIAMAIGLPFAIEAIQMLAPALGRVCQSADVADNLTGFVIGLGLGIVSDWTVTRLLPPDRASAATPSGGPESGT
jgi:hypothetical protein